MKNSIDSAAQIIFAKLAGSALIIFATLFGIASISNNSAKADSPNTVNSTGKIMLDAEVVNLNGKVFYSVIAWDTETGKSSLYSINYSATTPAFQKESSNLPSSPLY